MTTKLKKKYVAWLDTGAFGNSPSLYWTKQSALLDDVRRKELIKVEIRPIVRGKGLK